MNPTQLLRATRVVCSELSRLGDDTFGNFVSIQASRSLSSQTHEPITVAVHATTPEAVEAVAQLFNLDHVDTTGRPNSGNYTFRGGWPLMEICVEVYGPQRPAPVEEPADCYASEWS